MKIGLTATNRGRDRLLEQGAITAILLGTGPHLVIRRAERAISAAGLAAERIGARAKADAWWALPDREERARQVLHARTTILDGSPLPDGVVPCDPQILDQAAAFGLAEPLPDSHTEVKAISDGATLSGNVRAIIGRRLLLDTSGGVILADMRRIAGWQLTHTDTTTTNGLDLTPRNRPRSDHEDQESLF